MQLNKYKCYLYFTGFYEIQGYRSSCFYTKTRVMRKFFLSRTLVSFKTYVYTQRVDFVPAVLTHYPEQEDLYSSQSLPTVYNKAMTLVPMIN